MLHDYLLGCIVFVLFYIILNILSLRRILNMFHLALASQNALCRRRREEDGEFNESDGKGKWGKGEYRWGK
jgi:hypothetical protein